VLSRFTAYVAIDHAETANKGGKLHRITQPVESPQGWAMQERASRLLFPHDLRGESFSLEPKAVSAAFDRTAPLPRTRNRAVALRDMLAAARGGGKGLNVLTTLYLIGAAIAVLMIFANWEGYTRQEGGGAIFAYSLFFLLWGGLIWARGRWGPSTFSGSRKVGDPSAEKCGIRNSEWGMGKERNSR